MTCRTCCPTRKFSFSLLRTESLTNLKKRTMPTFCAAPKYSTTWKAIKNPFPSYRQEPACWLSRIQRHCARKSSVANHWRRTLSRPRLASGWIQISLPNFCSVTNLRRRILCMKQGSFPFGAALWTCFRLPTICLTALSFLATILRASARSIPTRNYRLPIWNWWQLYPTSKAK